MQSNEESEFVNSTVKILLVVTMHDSFRKKIPMVNFINIIRTYVEKKAAEKTFV
jgi:hypothetical protein